MDDTVAHILAQTRRNIDFLASHNQISSSDAQNILLKLPAADASVSRVSQPTNRRPSPAIPMRLVQARAIWDYNAAEPNELSFHPGDIIDVLAETNTDWWTGRLNGGQGLFPSSYVEKLSPPPPSPSLISGKPMTPIYNAPPPQFPSGPPSYYPSYNDPPRLPINQYPGPPSMQNSVPATYGRPPATIQAPAASPPKKHKFGGLGNTLAHAAAGGVGFGAGSAIANDMFNSIF